MKTSISERHRKNHVALHHLVWQNVLHSFQVPSRILHAAAKHPKISQSPSWALLGHCPSTPPICPSSVQALSKQCPSTPQICPSALFTRKNHQQLQCPTTGQASPSCPFIILEGFFHVARGVERLLAVTASAATPASRILHHVAVWFSDIHVALWFSDILEL